MVVVTVRHESQVRERRRSDGRSGAEVLVPGANMMTIVTPSQCSLNGWMKPSIEIVRSAMTAHSLASRHGKIIFVRNGT